MISKLARLCMSDPNKIPTPKAEELNGWLECDRMIRTGDVPDQDYLLSQPKEYKHGFMKRWHNVPLVDNH